MRKVFDCFLFFNELDVLDIRLKELDPFVDHFVLVESTRTFTGLPKELVFEKNKARFQNYLNKIIHIIVDDDAPQVNTAWDREAFQRNTILRGLKDACADDAVIISDVDEIPKPSALQRALIWMTGQNKLVGFWCQNYFFRLNLRYDYDHRLGPRLLTYGTLQKLKPEGTRHIPMRFSRRSYLRWLCPAVASLRGSRKLNAPLMVNIAWDGAWHFTCIGDEDNLRKKLKSFSHTELDLPDILEGDDMVARFARRLAKPGEPATYLENGAELPRAIQNNRQLYATLLTDAAIV